jgi:hypothetical protein
MQGSGKSSAALSRDKRSDHFTIRIVGIASDLKIP